ncbi:bifunctional diaminohydroxyphosphoribosylaminopyrimidine deaminase/5-amino-6-(5-phosphoribosylamino)uracil reductase RibD [Mechercharimyces sp. CAU 1602]|uniref:bifunctional diaminohydroxyphosphoribosylaminopyrimidine deaminase/5-amino-6-(5-phosphoribosylamino)uracil reductase RibD n=1 Tax=Mechercharimyces sp. CAU 1602 TaxID=2973933 RepID=UPI002162E1F3|nr:bifunctional diaminohydroxyphosphoribosylaminopyrimidine deaminase/5-amino-6-(5-phosphoribosylamino)uracil reductase RibD [Mechercharimyces sp. CAU 1602]MCS1350857.1 bifunctional diaminohydroxyphosphoribosylaminopyrimidine deaminase/5-amino-6-(5-phosphoribosylamino)uracil reductase RibD [Mechercharimyces sp. CAU 1602]
MNRQEEWMRLALTLAQSAEGYTSPNPMVGAVIVKEGRLVGSGAHLRAGTAHAEVHALAMAGAEAEGSTLYVTLEPCSHHGRTPPCTDAVIKAKVAKVVIAVQDNDERVSGSGIERLRQAGIEVEVGLLATESRQLNEAYFHHRRTGRPLVTLKTAMTLDGKIATSSGDSKWISNEESRAAVHLMRHRMDAIMVGIGTVLTDRPQLTARLPQGGKNPVRIIVDSKLQIPLDTPVADTSVAETWVYCTATADPRKRTQLQERGVKVFTCGEGVQVDLPKLMEHLGEHNILSVLVEGGGTLNGSLLMEDVIDRVVTFIAPKLVGGANSLSPIGGEGISNMDDAVTISNIRVQSLADDVMISGEVCKRKGSDSRCLQD